MQKYLHSNTLCTLCQLESENQQHILRCKVIQNKLQSDELCSENPNYEDIFSCNINKQKHITALFLTLFKIKENFLEENNFSRQAPSNTQVMLDLSDNVQPCIVHSSLEK